ncbi:ABC transporter ATP-binding protein [Bradyrhizobium sp. LHD-71]|uniref:ABC transporter ATP-binding protein n=1 Tax=Bradyrhizobium sp. LHD-71 TaxID=3072141 RepID=UPI00280FF738|nr:ABC transporter ATP-binding protein [Bradyrhizobium sp. LHD-71]MDQ8728198.1 ABC transporter ATP-binding protein [Bradyrhizobium sp. LHD-71]
MQSSDPVHEPILDVTNLSAGYGSKRILDNVSFAVKPGEIALFVGHNGAGKSTILKGIMGLLPWTSGTLRMDGVDLGMPDVKRNVRNGINIVLQHQGFFPNMSVTENLGLGVYSLNLGAAAERSRIERVFEIFPRLFERRDSRARLLSGGEQRMLSIGIALMTEPRLLLIDEPSAGLAPNLVDGVMTQLQRLNREWGSTILLVEQNVRAGLQIATSVLVVRLGTIAAHHNADAVRERDEIWSLL